MSFRIFGKALLATFICTAFLACQPNGSTGPLFKRLSKSKTGIDFRNLIVEKETFNIFKYQYFYNGGGVAVGDFNNDNLQDLFFTGNMVKNRLYLNNGGFSFEDITKSSGVAEKEGWCTGATPVDINADGWLDLYVCRAGYPFDNLRSNLLYVNNGPGQNGKWTGSFTEKSAEYGLADLAHCTQASFFDYDKDGDLDLFLLNHSTVEFSRGSLEVIPLRAKKNPAFTNKLLRNDAGKYTDVTEMAGIYANVLTFSLGICAADLNGDGWTDIFIGNDFNEPDYVFINNQNGTFTDKAKDALDHTSMFTMGVDIADFNNDCLPDIVSLDMLPESNHLQKLHAGADNYDKVNLLTNAGLLKQFSRNMLQLNNGDGTFSEIGQLAGVSNTDWSWSPLFFDFDNDGWKDLFISNGYLRDHTDMDFLKFTADEVNKINRKEEHVGFQEYLEKMPPIKQSNYFFQNTGEGFHFADRTADWSDNEPSVTQGAAYVDLDNDGDLDLVTNNSEDFAGVFENHANAQKGNHYLKIKLKGNKENPIGIGTQIWLYGDGRRFFQEQNPIRGFQTAVDPVMHFGVGKLSVLDSVVIVWPTQQKSTLFNVPTNQTLEISIGQSEGKFSVAANTPKPLFEPANDCLAFRHQENGFSDFKTQLLLPWYYSRKGPALATGDVNGDGKADIFCGGGQGQAGAIFVQNAAGKFTAKQTFDADKAAEDIKAEFFDADGDKDLDLYVCSGGYEFAENDPSSADRLYLNVGQGHFTKSPNALPPTARLSSVVRAGDLDGDGDLDLFLGAGVKPGRYPERAGDNQLLINNGKGQFTAQAIPCEGITTDAAFVQIGGDQLPDLVVVGEWAPIQIFENKKGRMERRPDLIAAEISKGIWQSLAVKDVDMDGDMDMIVGNLGLNTQFHAPSPTAPLELFAGDFDGNGSVDPLLFYYNQGKSYPFPAMEDLNAQIPPMKKKFIYFKDYADAGLHEILNENQLKTARHYSATTLASVWLKNEGGKFTLIPLPEQAQIAPMVAMTVCDVNEDGFPDMVTAGNISKAKVKLGSLDGNHGQVLLGDGKGGFKFLSATHTGINLRGDVRSICQIKTTQNTIIIFGDNDSSVKTYRKHP